MLQLKNLTLYRNGRAICRDLFFEVSKGSCVVITGKNGSGKSSLLETLVGGLHPSSGQVLLDHHDVHRFNSKEKKLFLEHTGVVFQHESLRPFDSLRSIFSSFDRKECSDFISSFGLDESALVQELSYSQRRIVSLMLAFLKHPKLLILDEPFLGLDEGSQEKWRKVLLQEKSRGSTIIVASNSRDSFNFLNPEKILTL